MVLDCSFFSHAKREGKHFVGRGPTPREGFLFDPHPNPPHRGGSKK